MISSIAKSIRKAMGSVCQQRECINVHEYDARLALVTYRDKACAEGQLELDMLLCLDALKSQWQEAETITGFSRYFVDRFVSSDYVPLAPNAGVFEFCKSDICQLTALAIDRCLDLDFGESVADKLSEDDISRRLIYKRVVFPQEIELSHGYGEGLVDRLDELTPSMDVHRLGQVMNNDNSSKRKIYEILSSSDLRATKKVTD